MNTTGISTRRNTPIQPSFESLRSAPSAAAAKAPTAQTGLPTADKFEAGRSRLLSVASGAGFDPGATLAAADAEINDKINPARHRMDGLLALKLTRMFQSPTFQGATPPTSPNGPLFFKSFNREPNGDPNNPDAQVYTYRRDNGMGGKEWATFEIVGSFSRAYATIDPGRAGTNSALGLPISGREMYQDGPFRGLYFQNFENGTLVQTEAGNVHQPARFTWLDTSGRVVKSGFPVAALDLSGTTLSPADQQLAQRIDQIIAGSWPTSKVQGYGAVILDQCRKEDVPVDFVLAQLQKESSFLSPANTASIANNNPANLRWSAWQQAFGGHPGGRGNFTRYDSIEDGLRAHIHLLRRSYGSEIDRRDYRALVERYCPWFDQPGNTEAQKRAVTEQYVRQMESWSAQWRSRLGL